jgi:hypothetical protein
MRFKEYKRAIGNVTVMMLSLNLLAVRVTNAAI